MNIGIVERRAGRATAWLYATALLLGLRALTTLNIPVQIGAGNVALAILFLRLSPWLALLAFPVSLATRVLFLMWVHGSNRLAHEIAEGAVTVSPFASVAWFFAPIFSWWMPFVGIRECYQASVSPDAPELVPVPRPLRWWWGLFIAYSVTSALTLFPLFGGGSRGPGGAVAMVVAVSEIIYVPMAFAAVAVIRLVTGAERFALSVPA